MIEVCYFTLRRETWRDTHNLLYLELKATSNSKACHEILQWKTVFLFKSSFVPIHRQSSCIDTSPIISNRFYTMSRRLHIVAGTYEGVLAGWELQNEKKLQLTLATGVHQGSIRSLALASTAETPGTLLSTGYDEVAKTHDFSKAISESGEIRTPSDFGTPTCSSFGPKEAATHCLMGFAGGKLALYKKKDWSVQHVLAGHDGGVSAIAIHPSGKLALSGGTTDGKVKLWDLTKGRLAYVAKMQSTGVKGRKFESVTSIVWSMDGSVYGWAYGSHMTVKDVASGKDLLDVDLGSTKINQMDLLEGPLGIFCVGAGNDGSLPILMVGGADSEERKGMLAIEPVDGAVAREERFNSAGVVSVMNLMGAVSMIVNGEEDEGKEGDSASGDDSESERDDSKEEEDPAVDIIDSVQLGSGARITCLAAWFADATEDEEREDIDETSTEDLEEEVVKEDKRGDKRKAHAVEMDQVAVEKARMLVQQATKIQKRKKSKSKKPNTQ
jgi:protein MAK11